MLGFELATLDWGLWALNEKKHLYNYDKPSTSVSCAV